MSEKESKESRYIVLSPVLGTDPPFGSDRDPGVTCKSCDRHMVHPNQDEDRSLLP